MVVRWEANLALRAGPAVARGVCNEFCIPWTTNCLSSVAGAMSKRVILWAAPKSISTAFERSMRTLDYCKVIHEPYGSAYHFGPDKESEQYSLISKHKTGGRSYRDTTAELMKEFPEYEAVFIKDLASYVENKREEIMQDGLSTYTHTFLIRRPDKTIHSFYTCGQKIPNWLFNPVEAGFQSLYKLYRYVHQTKPVVVIDADDLLSAPDQMMKAYCNAVGIRYNPGMTSWEPGMVHDWTVASENWTDIWYKSVAASSGFVRRAVSTSEQDMTAPVIPSDLPEEVSACIRECWPLYQEMYAARLRL